MLSDVQHNLVTSVWTYYWQPDVFPAARNNFYCLCDLYYMRSLIGIAMQFCCEKEGLVLQPCDQKLGCPGFFPWKYHRFRQTCVSTLCPPSSPLPHPLYSIAQKGKTEESQSDCQQIQTIKQLLADRLQSLLCGGPEVIAPSQGCTPDGCQNAGAASAYTAQFRVETIPAACSLLKGWGMRGQAAQEGSS